jgi:hypothetical protein
LPALGLHDLAGWALAALAIAVAVRTGEEQVSRTAG